MSATAIRDDQVVETTMNAIILYDEVGSAANANAMLAQAAIRADEALRWAVKPWRFDLLMQPVTTDAAFKDAGEAHLIVLAVRSQKVLPSWLPFWLEQWARCRQVQEAALAVWDGENSRALSAPVSGALSEVAGRHGLSFIFDEANAITEEAEQAAAFVHRLHERENAITPTLQHILDLPDRYGYRHWGLNE